MNNSGNRKSLFSTSINFNSKLNNLIYNKIEGNWRNVRWKWTLIFIAHLRRQSVLKHVDYVVRVRKSLSISWVMVGISGKQITKEDMTRHDTTHTRRRWRQRNVISSNRQEVFNQDKKEKRDMYLPLSVVVSSLSLLFFFLFFFPGRGSAPCNGSFSSAIASSATTSEIYQGYTRTV